MTTEKNEQNVEERTIAQLLQDIVAGVTNPKLLDIPTRLLCVDALKRDGKTVSYMAHLLKCTERNIYRYLKLWRKENKLVPSKELVEETVGEFRQQAMTHHSYLMRLARTQEASIPERIQAEFAAWKVLKEFIEKMQRLGYLPENSVELYHHIKTEEGGESVDEVKKMLIEMESVARDTGTYTPKLAEEIKSITHRLEKAEIVIDAQKLVETQEGAIANKENDDVKQDS